MDIHHVRVPQDVDVVNVRWKPAKWGERPAFFPVHVDSCGFPSISFSVDFCSVSETSTVGPRLFRNVFRACLGGGAQLTICAQKWRNFVLFNAVSLRFVLSRVCVFLYSLGPSLNDFEKVWLFSRLKQWPNNCSILFSTKVSTGFTCASLLMSSFLMWSNLVFPLAHLNILISAELTLNSSHLSFFLLPNIQNRVSLVVGRLFWRLCRSIPRA